MRQAGKTAATFIPRVKVDKENSERTPKLLALLSERYQVASVPPSRFGKVIYDQRVAKSGRYLLFPLDWLANLLAAVRLSKRNRSRLVWSEGTYFALAGCAAAMLLGVPSVWDSHGNIWTLAKIQGKSGYFLRANEAAERLIASMAERVVVVSEAERRTYVAHGFREEQLFVLPTCADLAITDGRRPDSAEARRRLLIPDGQTVVLFFGTLSYAPNLDAARYISERLAPDLGRRRPDVIFCVAGSGSMSGPIPNNVRLLGFVPDLQLWLSACDVCIAPLWKGVGILTKVVDSLSAGKATVVTPLAVEGMPELRDAVNCLVGRDHEEFMAQLEKLLDDAELRGRLGEAGRRLVETSYSWSAHAPRLYALLDSMAAGDGS